MEKVIAALVLIAVLIGGYRFVQSRRKPAEQKQVETTETETEITITPTPENLEETVSSEKANDDLPSSGLSSDKVEAPTQEEMEKMIKEFELED